MSSPPALATFVVQRRGLVIATWAAACLLLLPASRRINASLDVAERIGGSESAAVDDALRTRFATPFASWAVLVVTGAPDATLADGRQLLRTIADAVSRVPGVTGTQSWLDSPDTMFVGSSGGSIIVVGLDPALPKPDALVPALRAATGDLMHRLHETHPALALRWTGFVPLSYDLRRTTSADVAGAEVRALPLTILLLLLAFGAVSAALIPAAAGLIAIELALGVAVILTRFGHLSILLENVVTMIGLGLGIDYALLTVSRFRESLEAGRDAAAAAIDASWHAGHTIALSGLAVAIGFGALLPIPLNELRSVGVGGLLVATISVLMAATLLPAVLSVIGRRIDAGRVRPHRTGASSRRWEAWGGLVARHPWRVLAVAGLPVLGLALQTLRMRTHLSASDWLPPTMESAQGLRDLRTMGRSAVVATIRMVLDLPPDTPPLGERAWNAVRRLDDSLASMPAVGRVRSLPALTRLDWSPAAMSRIPMDARRAFISRDDRAILIDVVPRENTTVSTVTPLARRLRAADAAALAGLPGARLHVGGIPGFDADYHDAVARHLRGIVLLVLGGTLLALSVGFRSILVPVKAVALNLLSVTAALGTVVIVFQDGHGVRWLGMDGATGGVFFNVPVLVFCAVFGLSMDYEVFLVARIAEARRRGADERAALIEGLARTGGVITSAAAIMIVVFAAFALGQFAVMKMLGVALAVAVALDATVVRLAIGPALLCLAGRWNWWPGSRYSSPHSPP